MVNNSILSTVPIHDISESGIRINSAEEFVPGTFVALTFSLPDAGRSTITAYGKVIWSKEEKSPRYATGLEFWHIDEENRTKLKSFVADHSQEKIKEAL